MGAGTTNYIDGPESGLVGGYGNRAYSHGFVGGGYFNTAGGNYAVALGGVNSMSSGDFSTICGGGGGTGFWQYRVGSLFLHRWRQC